jgi:hypothetical protein
MARKDETTGVNGRGRTRSGAKFHVDPAMVLAGAKAAKLKRVLVIGVLPNGKFYVAGSDGTDVHLKDLDTFYAKLKSDAWDDPDPKQEAALARRKAA